MRTARLRLPADATLDLPGRAFVVLLEHGAATALGLRAQAAEVLEWAEERLGDAGELALLRAAGPAAAGRFDIAREHLAPLLDGRAAPAVAWTAVEARLLQCALDLRSGSRPGARRALLDALAAAQVQGVVRPLLAAPADVAGFLAEQAGTLGRDDALAGEVLALRREREERMPLARLTERERAVLDLLPSQMSFEEIAEALAVTVNTVKSHVRAVYDKLGTTSRRDAVAVHQAQLGVLRR
jgi:LuxR family maltose regulon positive regulatory protein